MAKTLKARIVQKHDTEANWKKAINFIPKQAEIIVYDKDEIYDYTRFKVGDGTTKVNDLPFTSPLALALNETETQLVASTSVSFSLDAEHNTGLYVSAKNAITISSFAEGQKYRVVWDGKTYFVYGWRFTALKADGGWYDWQLIGNGNNNVIDGYFPENGDLPFAITQDRWENAGEWLVYAADGSTAATHTIEIYKIDGEYTKVTPEYIYNYNNFLKQGRAEHSGYVGLNSIGENMPSSFAVGDGNTLGGTGQCVFAAGGGNTINCTRGIYSEVHGSFNNVTGERVNSTFVAGQKNTINASGVGAVSVSVFGGGNTITGRWQATTVDGYGQKLDGSTGSNLGLFVHGYSNTITNENAGGQLGLSAVLGGFNKLIHTTTGSMQGNFILGVSNTIQDKSEVLIGGAGNSADINFQTIFGKFSDADETAALKVGWGTSGGARKNVFVVHDDGRATAAADPTASMDLVTKQYFEAKGWLLTGGTLIPADADLNNYNTIGTYSAFNDAIAGTIKNTPTRYAFKLIVEQFSSYIIQTVLGQSPNWTYSRIKTGAGWGEWRNFATTSDITSAINGQSFKTIFGQSITGSGSIIPYEAYLNWGGKNIAANFGPLDAALIPSLGANRLAFMSPDAITVEYSRDGGTTWVDYPTNDEAKTALFCDVGTSYCIGGDNSTGIDKSKYMVRFTINTGAAYVYTELKKFAIYLSTEGSSGCYCTITGRLQSNVEAGTETWKTFVDKASVGGWSGWNILNTSIVTYGNNKPTQYGQVRFTFGVTSHASSVNYGGLTILKILGFGGVGWGTPSTMAAKGRMYTWDYQQNVFFPQSIYANNKKLATEEQLGNYLSKTGITSQAGLTIAQTSSGVQVDSAVLIDNSLLGG